MGARVVRMSRAYNLENRALKEISKEKPRAAPRHEARAPPPTSVSSDVLKEVTQKNQPLLDLLRTVYVESTDPAAQGFQEAAAGEKCHRRPIRVRFPVNTSGLPELSDVPKGQLTLVEALRALGNHQHQPHTWTPDKIAQEYSLDPKDVKAVLEFFVPFKMELVTPQSRTAEQIKDS